MSFYFFKLFTENRMICPKNFNDKYNIVIHINSIFHSWFKKNNCSCYLLLILHIFVLHGRIQRVEILIKVIIFLIKFLQYIYIY